ncbi:MAG: trimethylamine methyltransferase family protein, partial [Proteobacteria bacterium]|nr:trimethylamine methyltransferase family protein [Pseudomonadota bacterium]
TSSTPANTVPTGGAYRPLSDQDLIRIHHAALEVLERIGMGAPPPELVEVALERGGRLDDRGRLCFPGSLMEDLIASAAKSFMLHGRAPGRDVEISGQRVHYATGGMAVKMLDMETNQYRPTTLQDLYDCARLVDKLDNLQIFNRTVVATEIADLREFDLNVAYACAAGTTKPIGTGFNDPSHVADAVAMFDAILGGEGRFAKQPFSTCNCCAVLSPLTYAADNSSVAITAARAGFPIKVAVAAQAGATAPAALAGTLVQTVAETLAALALVNLIVPGHPFLFCNWPFVSDLRTGSFSGGGGEEALLNAASAQIANFYGLPNSVAAGMTDSKLPDAQAGYEKGISTVLAGLAGANIVYESAGMTASLLGCSLESYVIDNDMLGVVQRAIRGIEVTDETLSVDAIEETVNGAGHFLGHPQTYALMKTEYVYPDIASRSTPDEWEAGGSLSIRDTARERTQSILHQHYPAYIDPDVDIDLRARFPIRLPVEAMRPGSEPDFDLEK